MLHVAKVTDLLGRLFKLIGIWTLTIANSSIGWSCSCFEQTVKLLLSQNKHPLDSWLKMASQNQEDPIIRRVTFGVLNKVTIFGNIFYQAVS